MFTEFVAELTTAFCSAIDKYTSMDKEEFRTYLEDETGETLDENELEVNDSLSKTE